MLGRAAPRGNPALEAVLCHRVNLLRGHALRRRTWTSYGASSRTRLAFTAAGESLHGRRHRAQQAAPPGFFPARPLATTPARRPHPSGLPRRYGGPRRRPSQPTPASPADGAMQRSPGPCPDAAIRPRPCLRNSESLTFGRKKEEVKGDYSPMREKHKPETPRFAAIHNRGFSEGSDKPKNRRDALGASAAWFVKLVSRRIKQYDACGASRHTDRCTKAEPK